MYGIPKNKRKITAKIARQIILTDDMKISIEDAELILDMMYDFAKLALNQQLQNHF